MKQYSEEEIKALERREKMNADIILQEIKELKAIALRNDRALRGSNGDPGLIQALKELSVCAETLNNHNILLKGDPKNKDDSGLVGEQIKIREWVGDIKENIKNVRWWVFVTIAGLAVEIILSLP